MQRRRVTAYGVIATIGVTLIAYGVSPIRPSRHGFNELFCVIVGSCVTLVGVIGCVAALFGPLIAKHRPRE